MPIDFPELTMRSLAFLREILEQERHRFAKTDVPFPSSPSAFIYLHARNICELGNDVLTLELTNRLRASRILARPMLESLFSLAAAAKDPAFPVKKIVAEQEDQIERFKKWIEEDHYDEFQDGLEEEKQKVRDLRQKHSIVTNANWNARQTAEAAGLDWHYKRDSFGTAAIFIPKSAPLSTMRI